MEHEFVVEPRLQKRWPWSGDFEER